MSKFKVGDKVVRLFVHGNAGLFEAVQGIKDYYTITDIGPSGYGLQLDGVRHKSNPFPWHWANFKLYQEPEDDELPPVPSSVSYLNTKRDPGNDQRLVLERPDWLEEDLLYIGIVPKEGSTRAEREIGINMSPDAALQLAHDLRRMAMAIRREGRDG